MSRNTLVCQFGDDRFYNLNPKIGFFFFTKKIDRKINNLLKVLKLSSLEAELKSVSSNRSDATKSIKKYLRPEWQKRSPIKDVFCRYGAYHS